jgi:hypothetical protein
MLPCDVEEVAGSSRAAAARVAAPTVSAAKTTAVVAAQQQLLVLGGPRALRLDGQGGGLTVGVLMSSARGPGTRRVELGGLFWGSARKVFLKEKTKGG